MIPWCKSTDYNFGYPIGSLKDTVTKKGKYVFGFIINGWHVKTLPSCEKAKCYHKSKYRDNKY